MKEVKDQQKAKKQKHKDRMVNKKEKLEEMEEMTQQKKEAIMKKFSDLETRRNEVLEKRAETYHKQLIKEQEHNKNHIKNRNNLQKSKQELNQFVLSYQSDRIGKASLKDHSINLNRLNA